MRIWVPRGRRTRAGKGEGITSRLRNFSNQLPTPCGSPTDCRGGYRPFGPRPFGPRPLGPSASRTPLGLLSASPALYHGALCLSSPLVNAGTYALPSPLLPPPPASSHLLPSLAISSNLLPSLPISASRLPPPPPISPHLLPISSPSLSQAPRAGRTRSRTRRCQS